MCEKPNKNSNDCPVPNPTGVPTKTNIAFIRSYVEKEYLDVSVFDRIRLVQWIRQLLKYIDQMETNKHDS